ncbi:MAG: N-acetylmuramoyl-L-alanine amidase [Saprospiraceae bacterium]|nr:N-acetylmuramoyl-L-alanine amidase [Saprospiraceae bacterium]
MGRTVILDNGHGGLINGIYQTSGKRSPNWDKGVLFEGMFNRWVVNRIIEKLDRKKIPYYHISPEFTDTTLETRTNRANHIFDQNPDVWILSIHANAGGGFRYQKIHYTWAKNIRWHRRSSPSQFER